MQLSYCVGSVAAIVSCEKGRHVEGTPFVAVVHSSSLCNLSRVNQAFAEADHP